MPTPICPGPPRFPSSSGLQGSPTYSRDPPRHLGFTARSLVHHLPLPDADRGTPEALLPDRNSPRSGRFAGGRKPVAFNPEKTGEENRISKSEPGPLERRGEVSRGTDVVGAWRWSRNRRWPAGRRSPGRLRKVGPTQLLVCRRGSGVPSPGTPREHSCPGARRGPGKVGRKGCVPPPHGPSSRAHSPRRGPVLGTLPLRSVRFPHGKEDIRPQAIGQELGYPSRTA